MEKKPPTEAALRHSFGILVDSSNAENSDIERKEDAPSQIIAYDGRIKAFEVLIQAQQDFLQEELRKLKRERNALSVFGKLPLAVFTSILQACLEDDPSLGRGDPPLLQHLAGVSRDWLRIIKSTPKLWTTIDGSWNKLTVDLFSRKAGAMPLNLKHVSRSTGSWSRTSAIFKGLVQEHSARWRSILIDDFGLEGTIDLGKHVLQNILIKFPTGRHAIAVAARTPLPEMQIGPRKFAWTGVLKELRILRLEDLSSPIPSRQQLLEAISLSPQLEIIQLREWPRYLALDPVDDVPLREDRIRLSALETLHCTDIPSHIVYAIAKSVVAPNCQRLVLDFGNSISLDQLNQATHRIGRRISSLIAEYEE